MFQAFALVCVMLTAENEQCMIFEDSWGPYTTLENCNIRARQMKTEIYQIVSPKYPVTTIETECVPFGEML